MAQPQSLNSRQWGLNFGELTGISAGCSIRTLKPVAVAERYSLDLKFVMERRGDLLHALRWRYNEMNRR